MEAIKPKIILASQSPRRKQLLEQLGWLVETHPVDIDETPHANELPLAYCQRITLAKAQVANQQIETLLPILTADTIVVSRNEILGKPQNKQDAYLMLKKLSGAIHQVISMVAVCYQGKTLLTSNKNQVRFTELSDTEINRYIDTGEPMDKAGSYGIQGLAAMWIENIEGSYSGIMGLPLYETTQLFKKLDIILPSDVLKTS